MPTLSIRFWALNTAKCQQLVTRGEIYMGYKFRLDIHIEYSFFAEMSHKLNGVKLRDNFNGKEERRHSGVFAPGVGSTKQLWDMPEQEISSSLPIP